MEKLINQEFKEKENIQKTINDAKHLIEVRENYYKMIKFCQENKIQITTTEIDDAEETLKLAKGISAKEITDFNGSRQADGLGMEFIALASKYETGQAKIAQQLTAEQTNQIYEEKIK